MKQTIEYPQFEALELRVGQVVAVQVPEWSNKLLEFTVDFGPEFGEKKVLSGVKRWFTEADFLNKKFGFILNLPERKMGEGVSQAMMLMADTQDQPILIPVSETVPVGSVIR